LRVKNRSPFRLISALENTRARRRRTARFSMSSLRAASFGVSSTIGVSKMSLTQKYFAFLMKYGDNYHNHHKLKTSYLIKHKGGA